jgi:hypothetical protein
VVAGGIFESGRRIDVYLGNAAAEKVRQLFSAPIRSWKMQLLAEEAGVSLGQVANVKRLLLEREWIKSGGDGFQLIAPDKLLSEWSENEYDSD